MKRVDFDQWIRPEDLSEASGTSEKMWLRSPDGREIGLFKLPKKQEYPGKPPTISTEHVSEWIASQVGKCLDVPCAEVRLGKRDGRIGSMSILITGYDGEPASLIEGVNFIKEKYPQYNANTMIDEATGLHYCLEQVLGSTQEFLPVNFWARVLLFDFLIGNTDRHHSNWALLETGDHKCWPCPLYDNGSSLCSYVTEDQMVRLFSRDKGPMTRLTDTGSRSRIRIDGHQKKEPTHREVVRHLLACYPRAAIPIAKEFVERLTPDAIGKILSELPDEGFSEERKQLVMRYLEEKRKILLDLLREGVAVYD